MRAEFDFGLLTLDGTPRSTGRSVGSTNPTDLYSFRIGSQSDLNILLTGMTANADLRLYRDLNGNFNIDGNDPIVATSTRTNADDDSLNLSALMPNVDAGSYIVEVARAGTANTNYTLRLSNTTFRRPSPLLPSEVEVGTLTGTRSFRDFVGPVETSDTYHFAVNSSRNYRFQISGFSTDADLRLINDSNRNKVVDAGEVIGTSTNGRGGVDTINKFLSSGSNYFVQVYHYNGGANYNLSMSPV